MHSLSCDAMYDSINCREWNIYIYIVIQLIFNHKPRGKSLPEKSIRNFCILNWKTLDFSHWIFRDFFAAFSAKRVSFFVWFALATNGTGQKLIDAMSNNTFFLFSLNKLSNGSFCWHRVHSNIWNECCLKFYSIVCKRTPICSCSK